MRASERESDVRVNLVLLSEQVKSRHAQPFKEWVQSWSGTAAQQQARQSRRSDLASNRTARASKQAPRERPGWTM